MDWVVKTIIGLSVVFASFFGVKTWGKYKEKTKAAEAALKERDADSKITSEPYIDNPLDGMFK